MYTNIDTKEVLDHLHSQVQPHVLYALKLIMKQNVFQFSDTFWHQKQGTAMGTPTTCMWATLFFADHKQHLCDKYKDYLLYWSWYIDDGLGIWNWTGTSKCAQAFDNIKQDINGTSLEWEVNQPTNQVHYLDLTLTITNGLIESTLYEKLLSLYLYLPPGSAHPPSVLKGLIAGSLLCIIQLTSNPVTCKQHISQLFTCLIARGYTASHLQLIFMTYLD